LHATVGPSRTTISAIAERAGVQRHTVYAHFPDLDALYLACTVHGMTKTRMPAPEEWATIADPAARLRRGLADLYDWYRTNRGMLEAILHDVDPTGPATAAPDPFEQRLASIGAALAAGWSPPSAGGAQALTACVALAIGFETWRSLTGAGLSDHEAVELMAGLVEAVAGGSVEVG
jgi:AcrR family transcriptional regulator